MKEKFEYLIDKIGVNLIVNSEYDRKNNLSSLYLDNSKISNTYIVLEIFGLERIHLEIVNFTLGTWLVMN